MLLDFRFFETLPDNFSCDSPEDGEDEEEVEEESEEVLVSKELELLLEDFL